MQLECHTPQGRRQHSVYVHAGVANFIRVSKGAWTMLIALFKVDARCLLPSQLLYANTAHTLYMCSPHVHTTCVPYTYSLACWLSSAAADILLGKRETNFSDTSKLNRLQRADCFSHISSVKYIVTERLQHNSQEVINGFDSLHSWTIWFVCAVHGGLPMQCVPGQHDSLLCGWLNVVKPTGEAHCLSCNVGYEVFLQATRRHACSSYACCHVSCEVGTNELPYLFVRTCASVHPTFLLELLQWSLKLSLHVNKIVSLPCLHALSDVCAQIECVECSATC